MDRVSLVTSVMPPRDFHLQTVPHLDYLHLEKKETNKTGTNIQLHTKTYCATPNTYFIVGLFLGCVRSTLIVITTTQVFDKIPTWSQMPHKQTWQHSRHDFLLEKIAHQGFHGARKQGAISRRPFAAIRHTGLGEVRYTSPKCTQKLSGNQLSFAHA